MFELPPLPYAYDTLEPYITKKTLEFHHDKHHQAYVTNLNKLIAGTVFENATLETIILKADGGIFNNGAQVWNHTFYFEQFSGSPTDLPGAGLLAVINKNFRSFDKFKEEFSNAAATQFGSGWAWLVENTDGKLEIVKTSNAANPLRDGKKPLLTCDVWEHAYYLDVQNRRPDYIQNFWKVLDWKAIKKRFSVK